MENLKIQSHDFEVSKMQLKNFSERTEVDLELNGVESAKGVGERLGKWLKGAGFGRDHKVTGEELNSLTIQVQNHLIDMNDVHKSLIQEFGQVYSALEALDQDYIQAILIAIESAQQASEEVKVAQVDIEKAIVLQKQTIKVLEQFKNTLDQHEHLDQIDTIYEDVNGAKEDIVALTKVVKEQEYKLLNKIKIAYILAGGSMILVMIDILQGMI